VTRSTSYSPAMAPAPRLVLAGVDFEHVGELHPDRDAAGQPLEFMPQAAYAGAATARLNPHGAGPFCRLRIAQQVREAGVYALLSGDDELLYIGIADNLAERWGSRGYGAIHPRNCYVGGQPTNCKINSAVLREVKAGRRLHLLFARVPDGRRELEARLLRELRPRLNGRATLTG
jgi:hypothetical protein